MKQQRIFSIYSSKEICLAIQSDYAILSGIHLDLIAVRTKLSLKKIFYDRQKVYSLKAGDFVIAINHTPDHVFQVDAQNPSLLHFTSLGIFMEWIESYKENVRKEAVPLIAEKRH